MKNISLFISLMILSVSYAQNFPVIKEVLGAAHYQKMENQNPGLITFYQNFLKHGVVLITDFPEDKNVVFNTLNDLKYRSKNMVETPTIDQFKNDITNDLSSIFKYNIFPKKEAQFFKIEGTPYVLHILSIDQINAFNAN